MFLLFSGIEPAGGWLDYQGRYKSLKTAKQAGKRHLKQGEKWVHVVDSETLLIEWTSKGKKKLLTSRKKSPK